MICENCGSKIPTRQVVEGKLRNFSQRKFCLECSPFGKRNKIKINGETLILGNGDRYCTTCGERDLSQFYDNSRTICKRCYVGQVSAKRLHRKDYAVQTLGGKCLVCGFDSFIEGLCFHHLDPSIKDENFGSKFGWSKKRLDLELQKCVLLCVRCHAGVHAGKVELE